MPKVRRVFAWNHHTPFWAMWRKAVSPDVRLFLAPTPHAPEGWRRDQRPFPDGVGITAAPDPGDDLVIVQTFADWNAAVNAGEPWPVLILSHNKADYEGPLPDVAGDYRLPVVCISEMKAQSWRDAGFRGKIMVIPPGIDVADYGPWVGDVPRILTVANNVRRPLFDLPAWLEATKGLPVTLVGEGNEGLEGHGAIGPAKDWEHLKTLYSTHAVYLNPTHAPAEDAWNLGMLEAAATGMPIASLHEDNAGLAFMWGERADRKDMEFFLESADAPVMHEAVSPMTRENVSTRFPLAAFAERWQRVLSEVAR